MHDLILLPQQKEINIEILYIYVKVEKPLSKDQFQH